MRSPLKIAAVLVAGFTAIVALGLFGLVRMIPDVPRPDDADILPIAAPVADADDAYPDFVKLREALAMTPEERTLVRKESDAAAPDLAAVEPLIARNAEVLARFADFSRRARFSDPSHRDLSKVTYETPVTQHFPLVTAAQLASLRSSALLKQGRAAEALEAALQIMDAGQVHLRSDQPLIGALVGLLVSDLGARRTLDAVRAGGLDKAALESAVRRLSAYKSGVPAMQSSLRFEYHNTTMMVDRLLKDASKSPDVRWHHVLTVRIFGLYQREATRALFAGRWRGIINEAAKPCAAVRPAPAAADAVSMRNWVGHQMFNMEQPAYEKLFIRRCEHDFRAAAALTGAALAAYKLELKRYPVNLAVLVPRYLPALPPDPFTGEPLLYSADTGEVHSKGKDAEGKPL